MEQLSLDRLAPCCPALTTRVVAASDALNAMGIWVRIISGLRGEIEQQEDWQKGRTPEGLVIPYGRPGHGIVTNAQYGYSMHNYGMAVDVVPFLHGQSGDLNWNASTGQFQAMVAAMTRQGLAWGGDWIGNLRDLDHFQLKALPTTPTPQMRATLAKNGVQGVWSAYSTQIA